MYAEIKSSNKILINRLDDNERIILKDFCDKVNAEGGTLTVNALTDEAADFGGILIEVENTSTKE